MAKAKHPEIAGLYRRGKSGNFTWFYRVNGRQRTFATGTNVLADAIVEVQRFRQGPEIERHSDWTKSVDTFIRAKVDEGYAERTKEYVEDTLTRFGDFIHGIDPDRVTAKMIRAWLDSLGVNETSQHTYFRALRVFFNWLEKQGMIKRAPTRDVHQPKSKRRARIIFCTPEQRDTLLEKAKDDPDMTFILRCGFDCGLRKDEIINARNDWFDIESPIPLLHVQAAIEPPRLRPGEREFRVKSKARSIAIPPPFVEFLRGYLHPDADPLDFTLRPTITFGKSRYRYDFRRPFGELLAKCNMAWFDTHAMRHTFASILLMKGAGIGQVAKALGDSEATVEEHYNHFIPSLNQAHLLYS